MIRNSWHGDRNSRYGDRNSYNVLQKLPRTNKYLVIELLVSSLLVTNELAS